MDSVTLSEAIRHDLSTAIADEVRGLRIEAGMDVETIKRQVQALGRRVLGPVVQALVQSQGEALA